MQPVVEEWRERSNFSMLFAPPSAVAETLGVSDMYLFSWKASFNSGGGNFPRCHHPKPLARPFDQCGGVTRGFGSQPSCKSHWSRSVNVSDVQTGVRQSVPGSGVTRLVGFEKTGFI